MLCVCGSDKTYVRPNGNLEWVRHEDEKGIWNGRSYSCKKCYSNGCQRLPDSYNSVIKNLANFRTGNLGKDSETGKSLIDQAVVSKVLGIEDLNITMNNLEWCIDAQDDVRGKIDVKSSKLGDDGWSFGNNRKIECDTYICLGYDANRCYIAKAWEIPNDDNVISICTIHIRMNSLKYEKFEIDETSYNDAYQSLRLCLKDKTHFGVKDIKKWLKY